MIKSVWLVPLFSFVLCHPALAADSTAAATSANDSADTSSVQSREYKADMQVRQIRWKSSMDRALEYVKNGDYVAAQKMVDIARKQTVANDPDDSSLAETEKIAGDIAAAQSNMSAAERSYRRSVYLYERANAPDKSEFSAALMSYAELLKRENRLREAARFEMQANQLRRDDNSTAETNRSL